MKNCKNSQRIRENFFYKTNNKQPNFQREKNPSSAVSFKMFHLFHVPCSNMFHRIFLLLLLSGLCLSQGDFFKEDGPLRKGGPGPWVKASKGQPWPQPKLINHMGANFLVVQMSGFTFEVR